MKRHLNSYLRLEEIVQTREWFIEHGIRKEYKKGDFFEYEGKLSQYIGFIEVGAFRYLKWDEKGQEQVVGFGFTNDFVGDYVSLRNIRNAVISSQAMSDSVVWVISNDELDQFFDLYADANIRAKISEVFSSDIYDRLMSLYVDSATSRYIKLINRFPQILELVTLKEIASYIRVTPETLSRIRRKIASQ